MTTVLNNSKFLKFRMIKNFKILEHNVLNQSKPSFGRHPIIIIILIIFILTILSLIIILTIVIETTITTMLELVLR